MAEPEVPRETLIALIKKKEKDLKTAEAKLDKIEDRYVKLVRFNKILHEDRASFLKFCALLLPDPETAFEEAAAQETPINLDLLTQNVESLEAKEREVSILRDFVRLVFPKESSEILGAGLNALDEELRTRWMRLEQLQTRSLQEANVVAQQNVHSTRESVKSLETELRGLRAENRELSLQLQSLKAQGNIRAQQLTSRIIGNGPTSDALQDGGDSSTSPSDSNERTRELEQQIQQLQKENLSLSAKFEQIEGSYRAEVELSQKMLQQVKNHHTGEKKTLLDQISGKEMKVLELERKMQGVEEELDTTRMIQKAAELQANRDLFVREQSEESKKLRFSLREMEQRLRRVLDEERSLKTRIRELEVMSDANVDKAYLREVVYKYCEYAQRGDMKAQSLIPAVCTVIGCSNKEREALMKASLPTTWLMLNQAVGTWATTGEEAQASSSGSKKPPKASSQPPTPAGGGKQPRTSAGSSSVTKFAPSARADGTSPNKGALIKTVERKAAPPKATAKEPPDLSGKKQAALVQT